MAIIRTKDMHKMNHQDLSKKLEELKLELVKANVTANRSNAKTKEIKKTIARLLTLSKTRKGELKTK